jgi:hypothetical protein
MDLMNRANRSKGLRIWFELSTRMPTKVAIYLLTVIFMFFEVEVEVEDDAS